MGIFQSFLGRIAPTHQSLAAWCVTYDSILAARALKPKTLQNRRRYVAHLTDALGHRAMSSIAPADIAAVVRAIWSSDRPVAARRVLIEANDLFNEAVLARVLTYNPAQPLKHLPAPVRRARLSLEHWREIHGWAAEYGQPWFAYSLRLALVCAQRRADLVKMDEEHVWDDHLHVIQQKTGERVALPLELRCDALGLTLGDVILEGRTYQLPGRLLLRKRTGQPLGAAALTAAFTRARDAVFTRETWPGQTPPTFHEIRSLSERLYRAQGINTKVLLGHKRQSMTDLYNDDRGLSRNDWKVLTL